MLMNSYLAAAVLAFCAAQTGAAPVPVPPPELLAEKNISFQGVDLSEWTRSALNKRDAEAQWNTANADGSVPESFMQAVNKWQAGKSSNKSKSKDDKRDAMSVAENPDGSISPEALKQLERWNAQFRNPAKRAAEKPIPHEGPSVIDLDNGEYRPLMIQHRAAEAEAEAEAQVFSGLPSASWFKKYEAVRSKKGNNKREASEDRTPSLGLRL